MTAKFPSTDTSVISALAMAAEGDSGRFFDGFSEYKILTRKKQDPMLLLDKVFAGLSENSTTDDDDDSDDDDDPYYYDDDDDYDDYWNERSLQSDWQALALYDNHLHLDRLQDKPIEEVADFVSRHFPNSCRFIKLPMEPPSTGEKLSEVALKGTAHTTAGDIVNELLYIQDLYLERGKRTILVRALGKVVERLMREGKWDMLDHV
ncbi:hypothetical protein BJ508DRAFT_303815 [Ascobolus immersus RN42]|uniref:Uncharacterized protein n=1 Tax=Ascobolus immersus RN42 TaxID=1160509 RepID=A0A3N4IEY5_ASCIM|nr:hypothetical protein BJ508DRAFT_303815 [Ascobolus immersus RN42]